MNRLLVTGASGFVGSRLVDRLARAGSAEAIFMADRSAEPAREEGAKSSLAFDLSDRESVHALVRECRPTHVVHLAAHADVAASFRNPEQVWRTNTMGTLHLVDAIMAETNSAHMLFVSSAEVYGASAFDGHPVTESDLLQPANPYAASKAAADILVREASNRGLKATIVRPFNHSGPGQKPFFMLPSFCEQIAEIELGRREPVIHVGELEDKRDFMDVDDVVRLYASVIEASDRLDPGLVLNAASGKATVVRSVLDRLLQAAAVDIEVRRDPARIRANRVPIIVGDASRARELLGWSADIPFETTIDQTLAYWRQQVASRKN